CSLHPSGPPDRRIVIPAAPRRPESNVPNALVVFNTRNDTPRRSHLASGPDGSVRFVVEEVEVLDGDRDLDVLADADARPGMESADSIGRASPGRLLRLIRIARRDTCRVERKVDHDLGAERLEQVDVGLQR